MTDAELLEAFEACTLAKAEWTHEAHVRVGWMYLGAASFDEVRPRIGAAIQRYNASLGGDPGAYHETVTHAFLHLINHRMRARPDGREESFAAFRDANADLFDRTSPILLRHYAKETLASRAAHDAFVEPDRAPLP